MYRKILFVLILATSVGSFIYLKPYFDGFRDHPSFVDRLPNADFLGRCYILDLAKETSGMLFYNKIPFRDFFSQEFILSQGKNYGLNLQKPLYFFANENGNWGVLVEVTDSSKILPGIQRLTKLLSLTDTLIYEQKTYKYEKELSYITYDKNWIFLYKGDQFTNNLKQILFAKKGGIEPCWNDFLKEKQFKNEKLVIYSNWDKLKEQGVKKAIFAHNSDSMSFSLLTYIQNDKPLNIRMKKSGISLASKESTSKYLSLHLDVSKLRNAPNDPIYKYLVKFGKKISFPTVDFLNAWTGDLSFKQGGSTIVKETYVKSEMDDEFNLVEVKTTKDVVVPGFSLLFSVNEKGPYFIRQLLRKGILTHEGESFRVLNSPLLNLKHHGSNILFYSGANVPKLDFNSFNHGIWTESGTKLGFSLDSLSVNEVFGSIHIPVTRLIRRSKFL